MNFISIFKDEGEFLWEWEILIYHRYVCIYISNIRKSTTIYILPLIPSMFIKFVPIHRWHNLRLHIIIQWFSLLQFECSFLFGFVLCCDEVFAVVVVVEMEVIFQESTSLQIYIASKFLSFFLQNYLLTWWYLLFVLHDQLGWMS